MVHVLAFHAPYRCRHSGVCCRSGWDIPVEAALYRSLHAAVEWGQLRVDGFGLAGSMFEAAHGLPHGEPVVLRRHPNGACVFFEPGRGNLCAIQRQIDHDHLPSACRHFPRVVVIDPRGVFITLSHVCPTAAGLLLAGGPPDVITGVPGFDDHVAWEGLDARDELPPPVRPDLLWDWDAWDRWERGAVRLLAGGPTPERALASLSSAVSAMSAWRPASGALVDVVDPALGTVAATAWDPAIETLVDLEGLVIASCPGTARRPTAPTDADVPGWDSWRGAVCRYLAARAFANWVGYHGTSLATWYKSIQAAYAVLRLSAARAVRGEGSLDGPGLVASLAEADALVVHQSSPAELARRLDQWEESS